jgi:hypothetical protein
VRFSAVIVTGIVPREATIVTKSKILLEAVMIHAMVFFGNQVGGTQ